MPGSSSITSTRADDPDPPPGAGEDSTDGPPPGADERATACIFYSIWPANALKIQRRDSMSFLMKRLPHR